MCETSKLQLQYNIYPMHDCMIDISYSIHDILSHAGTYIPHSVQSCESIKYEKHTYRTPVMYINIILYRKAICKS